MKYAVVTFGCRVNQADSLALEAELCARGAEASSSEHADLVIVNTCSVTASADQGARQTIRRIARENPGARIVATGCYATRCPAEVGALPGVVAVVPNAEKPHLAGPAAAPLLQKLPIRGQSPFPQFLPPEGHCGRPLAPGLMGRTAWTLRVQTGCEERCSYCIIPTTRGPSRSRPLQEILDEVDRVVAAGYKEMAITGVHLGSYGRDLEPRASLAALLKVLSDRPALFRVSSLEPMDCTSEIVELMARGGLAPHVHLPLQHASNRVLRLMRRPYTIEEYAALVGEIHARLPHAAIGSDVIVGFPSETDDDFERLADYLEQSPLSHLHVFPYSDRPGTAASALPEKVHGAVVKARGERVRQISRRLTDRFRAAQAGTTRPALTIEDGSVAITDNYIRVAAPAGHGRNEWVAVVL